MNEQQKKNYNNNVNGLVKSSNLKKAEIEKQLGMSVGYMSRFNNGDPNSMPSTAFLEGIAKMFNKTIDDLINVDLFNLSPTEIYLREFIRKLLDETNSDLLIWDIYSDKRIFENLEEELEGYWEVFSLEVDDELVRNGFNPDDATFIKLEVDSTIDTPYRYITGDCYSTKLKTNRKIWLIPLTMHQGEKEEVIQIQAWSLWISVLGGYKLVISADEKLNPVLYRDLQNLKSDIIERKQHVQVPIEVKSLIDAYMNDEVVDSDNLDF